MSASLTGPKRGDASLGLTGLSTRAQDISPVWPKVGQFLSRVSRQQFATEGAFLGTPWKPLKPEYKVWKRRNGFGGKILVQTGSMKAGLVGRPMNIEQYFGNTAYFGTDDPKATWHHYGTHRDGKRVNPPRKIIRSTPYVKREVKSIINNYLRG